MSSFGFKLDHLSAAVDGLLAFSNGGGRFERHPEFDGCAGRQPTKTSSSMVADRFAFGVVGVVVGARSTGKSGWRIIVPLTLSVLNEAEHVANALRARGGVGTNEEG